MEEALRALLLASAAVTDLVPAKSIVWGRRIGLPAMAIWTVNGMPDVVLSGLNGQAETVITIDSWASSFLAARAMRQAAMAALVGRHTGVVQLITPVSLRKIDSEPGDGAPGSGDPPDFFRAPLDLRVRHVL